MDELLRTFHDMMENSLAHNELHAVIRSAMEPMNYAISAAAVKAGLPPNSYGFIEDKNTKYITKKKVTVLSGFKLGPNQYRKLDFKKAAGDDPRFHLIIWKEFGTVQRYKKDGSYTGYIKPSPFVRPIIDTHKQRIFNEVKEGIIEMVNHHAKINKLK